MKQLSQKRAYNKLAKILKRERKNAKPVPHFTNTANPIDFPKVTHKHIVQVHPVENGEPNLYKVKAEHEFDTKDMAMEYILNFNTSGAKMQAVYRGRVNTETGELE